MCVCAFVFELLAMTLSDIPFDTTCCCYLCRQLQTMMTNDQNVRSSSTMCSYVCVFFVCVVFVCVFLCLFVCLSFASLFACLLLGYVVQDRTLCNMLCISLRTVLAHRQWHHLVNFLRRCS